MKKSVLFFALVCCVGVVVPRALAQDAPQEEGATDPATDQAAPEDAGGTSTTSDSGGSPSSGPATSSGSSGPMVINVHAGAESDDDDDEDEEPPPQSPVDPHELEGQSYHHIGVFARGLFAPQFIQNLFVNGGTDGLNVGLGAFYNYRRDGLNIIAEVWWAGFYAQGPFYGLEETPFETEWVESELSVVFGSIALMWSIPLTSWLAFEIGFGLGFGGVFGGLYRTEAYPTADGFQACTGEGNPDPGYCDTSTANGGEGNYDRVENSPEDYNFSGGVPPLWFWVDLPRLAIRIKPLRQLQIRIEGGFAAYAFYAGGSLAFGF